MPFLTPRPGWVDWWEYRLSTGAGRHEYEVVLYGDDSAEIAVDYVWMGIDRHRYHLHGKHEKIAENYGWIYVEKIEKHAPSTTDADGPKQLNITDFEDSILFEYLRIPQAPHFQHPGDMLSLMQLTGHAHWNERFDVFLVVSRFVEEVLEGLHYAEENPSDEYETPDSASVKEVEKLLRMLDKRKLKKVSGQSK